MRHAFILSMLILVLVVQLGWGDIPDTISYQGLLTDVSGTPVSDGSYTLTFGIYSVDIGGAPLWSETHNAVVIAGGVFNVILGSITPLAEALVPFDQEYWLGVTIGSSVTELEPRTPLTSAPYSLNARSVADGAVTASKIASGQVVKSVNSLRDDVTLAGGTNVTVTPIGNTLSISAPSNDAWKLTGNAGTDPATNFLGTTDNKALELRVNNTRVLRLEPTINGVNVIGGYSGNSADPDVVAATIGGGGFGIYANRVAGDAATVAGGAGNLAGSEDFIGRNNGATVGGGRQNEATGWDSTIPGGRLNRATDWCFAAGYGANAQHSGTFVWADGNAIFDLSGNITHFSSQNSNEFAVRCTGGARFVTAIDDNGNPTKWAYLAPNTNQWQPMNSSDRDLKADFIPVDRLEVLERLTSLPVSSWSYKGQDQSIRHIGPTAQDFYEAFGLGDDDKSINSLDADGVALAAIQGLYELVKERDAQIAAQQQQIARMEARLKALETRMSSTQEYSLPLGHR